MNRIRSAGVRLGAAVFAVCMLLPAARADAANTWQDVRSVTGTRGIATDGTHYVAAAANGIWTSTDLKTWQRVSLPATAGESYNDVIWSGSLFVAAGDGVVSSPDGSNWTLVSAPDAAAHTWLGLSFSGGVYVAVGTDGTQVLRSTDGATWTLVNTGVKVDPNSSIILQGVGSNGTLFLAAGFETATSSAPTQGDVALTSPDGQTWTQRTLPGSGGAHYNVGLSNNVAFGAHLFVTGGTNGIYTSPDGLSWTLIDFSTLLPASSSRWLFGRIQFVNGQFVAAGVDFLSGAGAGDQIAVFTSSDGTHWASHDLAALQSSYYGIGGVTFAAGQYVAAGSQAVYSSSDAANWTLQSSGTQTNLSACIIQGGGKYVVPGEDGTLMSSDGITWPATPPAAFALLSTQPGSGCGAYGNGTYVTIYSGGSESYWSTDAANWTASTTTTSVTFQSLAWSGSGFLAVGYAAGINKPAGIATSPDGMTWTESTPSGLPSGPVSFAPPGGLIYANGHFVAWGTASGTAFIGSSTDGHAWSQAIVTGLPAGATIMSVAFGNGGYMALASAADGTNLLYSSSDGVHWNAVTTDLTKETWTTLIWGNNEFLAAGLDPATGQGVAAEGNASGGSWQTTLLPAAARINDVLWDGSKYVALSDYDILTLTPPASTGGGGGSGGGSSSGSGGKGSLDLLALTLLSGLAIRRRERRMRD